MIIVGNIWVYLIGVAIGIALSFVWCKLIIGYDGFFIVDDSNPETDVYRLDVTTDLDELPKKKVIKFRVKKGAVVTPIKASQK